MIPHGLGFTHLDGGVHLDKMHAPVGVGGCICFVKSLSLWALWYIWLATPGSRGWAWRSSDCWAAVPSGVNFEWRTRGVLGVLGRWHGRI